MESINTGEIPGADVSPESEGAVAEAEADTPKPDDKENEAESPPAGTEPDKKESEPFQERISTLTRNWRETQRKVEERDKRIAELEKSVSEAPKEPDKTLADFDYDNEKYFDYRIQKVEQDALKKTEKLMAQFQGQSEAQRAYGEFQKREAEFSKTVKDYRESVNPDNWACSEVMAGEIHRSDAGPDIAYHLAKNPDKAMEISQLSERDAVRQMVLLEASLKAEKSKTGKTVSDAPPPPPKVKGDDATLEKDYREGMSDAEFAKKRRKEIANR